MAKITLWLMLTLGLLAQPTNIEKNCLACHAKEQIPNDLIYRRYLMKYSSQTRIEEAMFTYLQDPQKSNSIMPPQFFLKFLMKPSLGLDDVTLKAHIKSYIERFDVKKRLKLDK